MKRTTTNKLNMYQSVFSVMSDFQSVWGAVPAFVSSVANFNSKLDLLRIRLTEQSSTTTGVSAEKDLRLTDLKERMLVIHRGLFLYGDSTGNILLRERNRKTKTSLEKLNIAKLAIGCNELKGDLELYSQYLSDYGISSDLIAEILPMLTSIDELNNSARKAILKRKSVTQSIAELERALDKILRNEMDNLILVFKKNQPSFFGAFRNARVIVDYGHHGGGSGAPEERDDGRVDV